MTVEFLLQISDLTLAFIKSFILNLKRETKDMTIANQINIQSQIMILTLRFHKMTANLVLFRSSELKPIPLQ